MWQKGCEQMLYSVGAILLKTPAAGNQPMRWNTIGTSFMIKGKPDLFFITNTHVICNKDGKDYNEKDLALVTFLPGPRAAICGIKIEFVEKGLDIAVLSSSKEGEDAKPVLFAKPSVLGMGSSVASIGFPIPPAPKTIDSKRGSLTVVKRLSTGFISSIDFRPNLGPAVADLGHYEINMLAYPGLSGAPVFDINGLVIGLNRGGLKYYGNFAAYACAVRSAEIIACLKEHNIEVELGSA